MFSEDFYESNLSFLNKSTATTHRSVSYQPPKRIITQKQMILDILYMVLGMPCSILTKKSNSQQYELANRYEMSHLSVLTLQNALKQCIQVCNETKYIEIQTKRLYTTSTNAVVRTFCEAVYDYLQQSRQQFSTIISEMNDINEPLHGKVTILSLFTVMANKNQMIGSIIRCLNTCFIQQERKAQVVRLLDKMWEIEQQMLSFAEFQRNSLINIFKKTLASYFEIVKDWLKMKKIGQALDFFVMIEDNKKIFSQYFLHRNEQIQPLKLPKLIQNESSGVLQIGKTLRFISLYYEDHQQQKLMSYMDIDGEFQILADALSVPQTITFTRVIRDKVSLNERIRNKKRTAEMIKQSEKQDNPFRMFTKQSNSFNINWIQKRKKMSLQEAQNKQATQQQFCFLFNIKCILLQILETVNKKCLSFFRSTHDILIPSRTNRIQTSLSNTLLGIKKFMLLEQGDFLQQFLHAASPIIDRQKKEISHNRIYGCIDQAIENSSAKNLPKQVLNCIHFDYIKSTDERSQKLRLWVLFSFNYRQDKDNPISYIFTSAIMDRLKEVCNFIIKLKKGQSVLTKIWNQFRETKNNRSPTKLERKEQIFRHSLSCYLNSIINYVLLRIQVLWSQYKQRILVASTVFQIVHQSNQIVQNLQKASLLDKLLYNSTMQCLMLVEKYRKLHVLTKDPTLIIPIKEIDQLDFELKSIVEIGIKISGLAQFVNYSGYFDQFQ